MATENLETLLELLRAHAELGAFREVAGSWLAMDDVLDVIAALERAERIEKAAQRWLDNEDRLDAQVAIHSSAKARDEAKAALRAALAAAPSPNEVPTIEGWGHVIEFRANGWTIMHPISCHPDLFRCLVNRAAEADLASPPQRLGRYVCWEVDGQFKYDDNPLAATPEVTS